MTSDTYRNHPTVNRVRPGAYLFQNRHNTLPGLNLHSKKLGALDNAKCNLNEFYRGFPLKSTCPLPLLPPNDVSMSTVNNLNSSSQLVREKLLRKRKITHIKAILKILYEKNPGYKDMIDSLPIDSDPNKALSGIVPVDLTKLALLYENDPDPYFKGVYNWYYGSTLSAHKSKDDGLVVISAGGKNLDELHLKVVNTSDKFKTETFVFSDQMVKGLPIYEVSDFKKKKLLTIRQKNRCALLKFNKSENSMNTLLCVDSKIPFCSVDISPFSKNELCMMKVNKTFQVWDVQNSTKKPKLTGKLSTDMYVADNWCNIRYGRQPNQLLATDRNHVYLYDMRMKLTKPVNQWNPWHQCEVCEEVSLLHPSAISPVHCYVGTSHQMFSLDFRTSFCQRWTHMMQSPPCIATSFRKNDMECLLFANQFEPGVECIVNDWTSIDTPISRVFPKLLPSVIDTYHEAKLSNVCNNPILDCRFDNFTMGLRTVKVDDDGFILFTSKSSGDVFYQVMSFSEGANNSDPELSKSDVKILKKFEKKCCKKFIKEKKTLQVTKNPVNLQKLVESLRKYEIKESIETEPIVKDDGVWQMSKSYLESCQDYLASKLLGVWDIKELPEWSIEPTTGVESGTSRLKHYEGTTRREHKAKEEVKELENEKGKKMKKKALKQSDEVKQNIEETNTSTSSQKLKHSPLKREINVDHLLTSMELGIHPQLSPDIFDATYVIPERSLSLPAYDSSTTSGFETDDTSIKRKKRSKKANKMETINSLFTSASRQKSKTPDSENSISLLDDLLAQNIGASSKRSSPGIQQTSGTLAVYDTSEKRLKPSRKPNKLDTVNALSTFDRHQKSKTPDLENSVSLLDDAGILLAQNIEASSKRSFSASQRTSRSPKESPLKIYVKEEYSPRNASYLDEKTDFEFLAPAATSTQAISANSSYFDEKTDFEFLAPAATSTQAISANSSYLDENTNFEFLAPPVTSTQAISAASPSLKNLGFSLHSSFTGSQNLLSPVKKLKGNCDDNVFDSAGIDSPLHSQSFTTRKRKASDSERSSKKIARLSQSFTPGF